MTFEFRDATKEQSRLRLAVEGPSGSGKTWTMLLTLTALAKQYGVGPDKIGVIDSERGSAAKYADDFRFKRVSIDPPFTPERYVQAIEAAERAGIMFLGIDSLTHEWDGPGGVLEGVDKSGQQLRGNKWAAWAEWTPRHQRLIDKITRADCHVVVTMRSKMETEQQEVNGRKEIVKLGMAAIQRSGFEYEYDVVMAMDLSHKVIVTKTRCRALDGYSEQSPNGEKLAAILHGWLASGVAPAPTPVFVAPVAAPPPPQRPQDDPASRPQVDLAASQAAQFPPPAKPRLVSEDDATAVMARNKYLTTCDQTPEVQEMRAAFRAAMAGKKWSDLWALEPAGPSFIEVIGSLGLIRETDGPLAGEIIVRPAPNAAAPAAADEDDPFADLSPEEAGLLGIEKAIGTTTVAVARVPEEGYTPLSKEQRMELEEAFQKAILRDGDSGPINDLIQKTIEGWGFTRGKGGSAWEMFVARGGAWHGQLLAAVHGMGASTADEADRTGRTAAPALEPKPAPSAPDWYLRKTPTQHESTLSDDCGDGTRFMVDRQNQESQWTIWRVRQDGAEMTVMGQKHKTFNAAVKKMNELVETQTAVLKAGAR